MRCPSRGKLKRIEEEVTETGEFKQITELFTVLDDNGIVGKGGLNVEKLPSDICSYPTKRLVESPAYLRATSYKADLFMASGTKQDIIAKLSEDSFPDSLNHTFAKLLNLLEDL